MDKAELQALQKPLKDRYREDPASALITLRAEGELDGAGISCSVATGRALVDAGLHPATGGTGTLACSGDMLLEALVACAGVTLRAVATALELDVAGTVRRPGFRERKEGKPLRPSPVCAATAPTRRSLSG